MERSDFLYYCIAAILFFSVTVASAGTAPQVTSATATFVDSGASVRVQWEAEEPITRVFISTGTERKTVDVDIRDNNRSPSGVSGEATAVISGAQSGNIAVQVEDEYRRKSEVVSVPITGQQRQMPQFGMPGAGFPQGITVEDSWGKENLARPKPQLPELKVGQGGALNNGTPGMPVQSQDAGIAQQQQEMAPQIQGIAMPQQIPMPPPNMNIPPPMPNQVIAQPPPIPLPQNTPGLPPPPPLPMDPGGMIPPPPPPPPLP